jgi:transposase
MRTGSTTLGARAISRSTLADANAKRPSEAFGALFAHLVAQAGRGLRRKGRDDLKFLEALHYFVVHNITWRALPERFGHWNSVWKRFWRLRP